MKQLICTHPGSFEYRKIDMPKAKPGFALVRVGRVGVCGTDLHAFDGTQPYFSYPRVLGHEIAGEIVEVPASSGFSQGDLVTIIPYFSCGTCIACRRGKSNCCEKISVFGVHEDGGMQEYISVPVSVLVKLDGLTLDQLAITEPLAIGLHGVKRASIKAGDQVLVVGAGPIGLGIAKCAALRGAEVIMMDVNEHRLKTSHDSFGAAFTVNALERPQEQIAEITQGAGCTAVFDATGNLGAINAGLQYLSHGGDYVLVGLQREPFSFSHPDFHKRETTLMSSRNATVDDFQEVLQLLRTGQILSGDFVSHRMDFGEVATGFASLADPKNLVIKALIHF